MSYVPNSLSESELSDIRVALEAAHSCADRFKHPMILLPDLSLVAMTPDNATMGLEVIQPDELKYVG